MDLFNYFILILLSISTKYVTTDQEIGNATFTFRSDSTELPSKVLSRRKRFLIFPDGSSLQLVFCTQTHGYLQIGDIVWFGNTAALAWELPADPKLFYFFKSELRNHNDILRRQDIAKNIYYLDEEGKVVAKVPYKRKPIVNPAFAKRSVNNPNENEDSDHTTRTISIKQLHDVQRSRGYFNSLDEASIDFHRYGRKDLYEKLETFLEALGWRGRECVLRMLCETAKPKREQGTFLEEIVKATFTLPRGRQFALEQHKEYDTAHGTGADCNKVYPNCKDINGLSLYDKKQQEK